MRQPQLGALGRWIGFGLASLLAGCAYLGQPGADPSQPTASPGGTTSSPSPTVTQAPTPSPIPSVGASPSARASDAPSPSATDFAATRRAKAHFVLERWANEIAGVRDPIIFVHDLTRGGGWRWRDANDQKSAFLSGQVEAIVPLSTDTPAPGQIVWPDGSRQEAQLLSAADAFADMVRRHQRAGSGCDGCEKLKVTGAKLVSVEHETVRGPASVPAWQFQFVPGDKPMHPISHVAMRDYITAADYEDWFEHANSVYVAYGQPSERRLTVGYSGSACAEADRFHGEAIETDVAVTLLIHYRPRRNEPQVCIAMAVGYQVTVELAAPLGDRYVIDPESGFPVPVLPDEPPPDG